MESARLKASSALEIEEKAKQDADKAVEQAKEVKRIEMEALTNRSELLEINAQRNGWIRISTWIMRDLILIHLRTKQIEEEALYSETPNHDGQE